MISTLIWDVPDYFSLFSQTFYGLLFSYLTMTGVTSHVHHKFPFCFLLYITTEKTCQINQIDTVNSSMNALISDTSHKKITLAPLACLRLYRANDARTHAYDLLGSTTRKSAQRVWSCIKCIFHLICNLVPRVFVPLDQRSENESSGSNHFRHAP